MHHSDHVIPDQPRAVPPEGTLYFVGVGGAGMSALAQVLAERGRSVTGADPGISDAVRERLTRAGVVVHTNHDAAHVPADASAIVVSDAIPKNNAEVGEAERRGLSVIRRPELLGALMSEGRGIAIAGTHGKTTTTGMVASILLAAGLDPTIFLGGDLPTIGGNARSGKGDIVLAESCEAYDGFLYLHPEIAVVLNIEADHLDYHGDEAHVLESFARFLFQVNRGGVVILCGDDPHAAAAQAYTPGWADVWEYQLTAPPREQGLYAEDLDLSGPHPSFGICVKTGAAPDDTLPLGFVTLGVPGRHNVLNALAAASVGLALHVSAEKITEGLEAFTGTGRRFETLGEIGGVLVIDDYAHHPTELRATLAAARSAYPDRRIVAVFQPHLPSRTRDLMNEFAQALSGTEADGTASLFAEEEPPVASTGADAVYLTDIYLAREQPMEGVTSEVLARKTEKAALGNLPVVQVADKNDLPARLFADVRPGDVVLTMGAGDIRRAGEGLVALLKEREG